MNTPKDASDTQINKLIDSELAQLNALNFAFNKIAAAFNNVDRALTHDTPDTAPQWDGVHDGPDPFTPAEAVGALDLHAAKAARAGNYPLAEDLAEVVRVIERLEEKLDAANDRLEQMGARP